MAEELKQNNMARTSKSRGVAPFKMRTGNSPLYKMMGSSPVKQDYDWKSTGDTPENVILPEDDNIIIDISEHEKMSKQKPQEEMDREMLTKDKKVTKKPTPDTKEVKSSGMSSDDFKAIGGAAMEAIGDIGKQMSADAQKEMATKSFTDIRSAFNKKSPYKKGIGKYAKKAKGSRGYKMKRK